MGRLRAILIAVVAAVVVVSACGGDGDEGGSADRPEPWRTQLGTPAAETSFGTALAPNGDVVVVASTEGSMVGANQGGRDIVVSRRSRSGDDLWTLQLGGPENDSPLGVSVAPDGLIYTGGFTEGDFAGPHQGSADVWLAQFDPDGTEMWRTQFGGAEWDRGFDVAAFDGGVYVTGYTASVLDPASDLQGFDGFAARFDDAGNMEWVRQFGTEATDWGQGAAAFDGGVYVTGYTEGVFDGEEAFGGKDAFVLAISEEGELDWVHQFGSDQLDWTQGVGIGVDDGVLVAGSTEGSVAAPARGGRDLLVAAFDKAGNPIFFTQAGTPEADSVFDVRLVGDLIVASGGTAGDLGGSVGDRDAILVWLELDGTLVGFDQFGSPAVDEATGLDAAAGVVVYSGYTAGDVAGPNQGGNDVFVGAEPS